MNIGSQRAEISEPSDAGSSEGEVSASVKNETKPVKQEKKVETKVEEEEPLMVESEKEDDDDEVGEDEFVLTCQRSGHIH